MKAAILTYYNVHNHGSSLQALGMKKVLESFGYDVSFLVFERNYDFIPEEKKKKYKLGISSFGFYLKYMVERGIDNIVFNLNKRIILNAFTKANLPIGCRYSDFNGALVVIGSDEVFSCEIGINPFFYGIGLNSKKAISYAASFGPTVKSDIEKHRLGYLLRSGFKSLDAISVRDSNTADIVKSYSDTVPTLVCDPVILYGYVKERAHFKPNVAKDYIIIYSYDKNFNDKNTIKQVRSYAEKNVCKIYSVGYYHRWCDKNICPDPIEMLGYFENAKLVITDTFHGAVVSIITETQFVVKLSGNQNKLQFLLSEYELTDRIVESMNKLSDIANNQIDYSVIKPIIEEKRRVSMDFLKKNVEINHVEC